MKDSRPPIIHLTLAFVLSIRSCQSASFTNFHFDGGIPFSAGLGIANLFLQHSNLAARQLLQVLLKIRAFLFENRLEGFIACAGQFIRCVTTTKTFTQPGAKIMTVARRNTKAAMNHVNKALTGIVGQPLSMPADRTSPGIRDINKGGVLRNLTVCDSTGLGGGDGFP